MKDKVLLKLLESPDLDEITSKLLMGATTKDIHEWLKIKYPSPGDSAFVLSEKMLKAFQEKYLDIYSTIKEDLYKTKSESEQLSKELELSVKGNKTYKQALAELATNELDIKKMIVGMVCQIELRIGQVFDQIQENPDNLKGDRVLMEWFDRLANSLEKYHKLVIEPPQQNSVVNNYNFNMVDETASVFYEAIKEVLNEMDVEVSLLFTEKLTEKLNKLKEKTKTQAPVEARIEEAKLLTEKMSEKI